MAAPKAPKRSKTANTTVTFLMRRAPNACYSAQLEKKLLKQMAFAARNANTDNSRTEPGTQCATAAFLERWRTAKAKFTHCHCKPCSTGTCSDYFGAAECNPCPHAMVTSTALLDYSDASAVSGCGHFAQAGYWAVAAQGSVASGGSVVIWSLATSQSTSSGVVHSEEFATSFADATGGSTSFEVSSTVDAPVRC